MAMDLKELYGIIAQLTHEGRREGCRVIVGGDFNAEVGVPDEEDDRRIIGQFGIDRCNTRGQLLKGWASTEKFAIANTQFKKRHSNIF
eukprot:7162128-Karenia_brevis.AAC.1